MSENNISEFERDDHGEIAPNLQARLEHLRKVYGQKDAKGLLASMIEEEFSGKIAAVSSFGAESAVLLSLISKVSKETPIIFLETGKHFSETLEYKDLLVSSLGLTNVRSVRPSRAHLVKDDPQGELWRINTDYCCHIRKVLPLEKSLDSFEAWITGRKRFQSESREELQTIELIGKQIKINPLATWNSAQLKEYFVTHNLPKHPLILKNYLSIGCAPCTNPVALGGEQRSGRWADKEKTECGIHRAP